MKFINYLLISIFTLVSLFLIISINIYAETTLEHKCIYILCEEHEYDKCKISDKSTLHIYPNHECIYVHSESRPGYSECCICGKQIPVPEHKCVYDYTDSTITGYVKCFQCGKRAPLKEVGNIFPKQTDKVNTTKILVIVGVSIILAVGAYIALSIRKKIKDKKYYSIDE